MSRRSDVMAALFQVAALLYQADPSRPRRAGDEAEEILSQYFEERERLRRAIERAAEPQPSHSSTSPQRAHGRVRRPRPVGLDHTRRPATTHRPQLVTRGSGITTRHRLRGSATIGSLIAIIELSALAHAFVLARSPRERIAMAGSLAAQAGMSYLALRHMPRATPALNVLFLQGDTPMEEEEEHLRRMEEEAQERAWATHVHLVTVQLANDLLAYELVLRRIEELTREIRRVGLLINPSYLAARVGELTEALAAVHDTLIESLVQLSRPDLPGVRQALVARRVPADLVNELLA